MQKAQTKMVVKKKKKKRSKRERLNRHLCPDKFEICVPKSCRLLGCDWTKPEQWKDYLKELNYQTTGIDALPRGYETPPTCCSCDGKEGWRLRGGLAVAHACRVHDKIHRQVLGLKQVNAIDVGFAITERQSFFENFLAIRVHVNKKLPPEQLLRAGLISFTEASFAVGTGAGALPAFLYDLDKGDDTLQNRDCCCSTTEPCDEEREKHLWRLLGRSHSPGTSKLGDFASHRYPITGVTEGDLSIFCPRSLEETLSLDDVRLCLCGVPIDVINAQYSPSITHPGGDANSGVFTKPPQRGDELEDDELVLIGRGRVNPMVGGVSIGSVTGQAGTLGTIVWDRTDATPCILSNWHVLAGSTAAEVGQEIYQPALFDGGTQNDVVAHLKRWRLGEEGDAALAELAGNRHYAADEILGLWQPISDSIEPCLNLEIRKWGRTTGFTRGFVDGIHLATNIDYGGGVVRYFRDQFHIAPLYRGEDVSQVGDSGSLLVASFRPIEQAEQLKQLSRWLIACCNADGHPSLCEDIRCGVREFKEMAKKIDWAIAQDPAAASTQRISAEDVVKLLEDTGLAPFLETRTDPVDQAMQIGSNYCLCCVLRSILELIREHCSSTREAVHRLTDGYQRLRCLHTKCLNCEITAQAACQEAQHIVEYLGVCQDTIKPCCEPTVRSICDQIWQAIECVREELEKARCVLELCAKIREIVKCWYKRCCDIEYGRALCAKICEALGEVQTCLPGSFCEESGCAGLVAGPKGLSSECKELQSMDLECVDPADLVRCLRAAIGDFIPPSCPGQLSITPLRTLTAQNPDNGKSAGGTQDPIEKQPIEKAFPESLERLGWNSKADGDWFLQALQQDLDEDTGRWFLRLLEDKLSGDLLQKLFHRKLSENDVVEALVDNIRDFLTEQDDQSDRSAIRAYYAVGMIFAGDTPGSPLGEFAVASNINRLAEELRFSLRPVFEPRSSFRELRVRPRRPGAGGRGRRGTIGGLFPRGGGSDSRPGGPQPDIEPAQEDPGSG